MLNYNIILTILTSGFPGVPPVEGQIGARLHALQTLALDPGSPPGVLLDLPGNNKWILNIADGMMKQSKLLLWEQYSVCILSTGPTSQPDIDNNCQSEVRGASNCECWGAAVVRCLGAVTTGKWWRVLTSNHYQEIITITSTLTTPHHTTPHHTTPHHTITI